MSDRDIETVEARLTALEQRFRESTDVEEREELAATMTQLRREIQLLVEE